MRMAVVAVPASLARARTADCPSNWAWFVYGGGERPELGRFRRLARRHRFAPLLQPLHHLQAHIDLPTMPFGRQGAVDPCRRTPDNFERLKRMGDPCSGGLIDR